MRLWDDNGEDNKETETESDSPSAKEILRDPSSVDTSSKRTYVRPTKSEFEKCLRESAVDWTEKPGVEAGEVVYESHDVLPSYDNVVMRCYSTISKSSGKARDKGSDAIRLVLFDKQTDRPIGGRKKTLRIKTYCKNLKEKIADQAEETENFLMVCDRCGGLMVIRNGKYGEFYGCREYPECENTEQISD